MKLLAKVVLGWLAYNYVKHDLRAGDVTHVGRRTNMDCLLYTSDAADEGLGVDLGGRRII